ncbi:hypothetical protein M885DRAFT_625130, partial [Pelagophyceae sp. CCMP2097]
MDHEEGWDVIPSIDCVDEHLQDSFDFYASEHRHSAPRLSGGRVHGMPSMARAQSHVAASPDGGRRRSSSPRARRRPPSPARRHIKGRLERLARRRGPGRLRRHPKRGARRRCRMPHHHAVRARHPRRRDDAVRRISTPRRGVPPKGSRGRAHGGAARLRLRGALRLLRRPVRLAPTADRETLTHPPPARLKAPRATL